MYAAREGRSTLGIPKKVGEEFVGKDMSLQDWTTLGSSFVKWLGEEAAEPEHADDEDTTQERAAAGIVCRTPDRRVLLLKRTGVEGVDNFVGHWALPGGGVEEGETPEEGAWREMQEEAGYASDAELELLDRKVTPTGMAFYTFLHNVDAPFDPKLNEEHSEFGWFLRSELPTPMHPAVSQLLDSGIALDRNTVREYDKDGRLHVALTPISKANICPYMGDEIPGYKELGLDPRKVYSLFRAPEELEKSASTSNGVPLLFHHKGRLDRSNHDHDLTVGATGTDGKYEHPFLYNSLVIWPDHAISAVEDESQRELSCGYHYRADMTPGEYSGVKYDGVMRDIVFNHVALVEEGRAGSDVLVGDSNERFKSMFGRKTVFALGALSAVLEPKMAQDKNIDVTPLFKGVTDKNFTSRIPKIVEGIKKLAEGNLAQDATLDDVLPLLEKVGKAKDEEPEPVKSAKDAEPVREFLKGKMSEDDINKVCDMMPKAATAGDGNMDDADDEDMDEKDMKEKEKAKDKAKDKAMDAKLDTMRKQIAQDAAAVYEARATVRPYVGELPLALDSEHDVFKTALTMMGVDIADAHPTGYKAILKAQPLPNTKEQEKSPVVLATDAASIASYTKMFPNAARITGV